MAYKLRNLSQHGVWLLTYSGKVTSEDFEGVWRERHAAQEPCQGTTDLVVLGPDVDYSDFAHQMANDEAAKFAQKHDDAALQSFQNTAVLCATDMQVVVTRMFSAYLMSYSPTLVAVECFRDLEQAIAWVETAKGDGRPIARDEIKRHLREMGHGWCCGEAAA